MKSFQRLEDVCSNYPTLANFQDMRNSPSYTARQDTLHMMEDSRGKMGETATEKEKTCEKSADIYFLYVWCIA